MFSETLRYNLDPVGEHEDDEIWRALENAQLKTHVMSLPEKLEFLCSEGGKNFRLDSSTVRCSRYSFSNRTDRLNVRLSVVIKAYCKPVSTHLSTQTVRFSSVSSHIMLPKIAERKLLALCASELLISSFNMTC
jgi:hypothetical protein